MSLKLIKATEWLNFFSRSYRNKKGKECFWDFCSRKKNPDDISTRADAVVVVPFLENGKMVIINQFRPSVQSYIIENVAGLIDNSDADIVDAAMREMLEEVGLRVIEINVYNNVLYNSVGITDESVSYVFCKAAGNISTAGNEDSEDIQILTVDRGEAKELISNLDNKISAKCWLILQAYANGFDWFDNS